jgi:hypothetical protein
MCYQVFQKFLSTILFKPLALFRSFIGKVLEELPKISGAIKAA